MDFSSYGETGNQRHRHSVSNKVRISSLKGNGLEGSKTPLKIICEDTQLELSRNCDLWKAWNDNFFRRIDKDPLELIRYAEVEFQVWFTANEVPTAPTQTTTESAQAVCYKNIFFVDGS